VKINFVILILFVSFSVLSQQKENPIVFAEVFGGYSGGSSQGWTRGFDFNFQHKKELFTLRFLELSDITSEYALLSPFTPFPIFRTVEKIDEIAALYGKRYVFDNKSLSFSVGISSLKREYFTVSEGLESQNMDRYAGFPFEFNIKWFHANRERYRIYGIIPIGKPISFGRSFGFKITGNISKTNFIGLSVSYGLGFHKVY